MQVFTPVEAISNIWRGKELGAAGRKLHVEASGGPPEANERGVWVQETILSHRTTRLSRHHNQREEEAGAIDEGKDKGPRWSGRFWSNALEYLWAGKRLLTTNFHKIVLSARILKFKQQMCSTAACKHCRNGTDERDNLLIEPRPERKAVLPGVPFDEKRQFNDTFGDVLPRFLVIGAGPHAKRVYIPHLVELEQQGRLRFVAAVDIEAHHDDLAQYVRERCPGVHLLSVPFFTTAMPDSVLNRLNSLVVHLHITHVIIATEPRAHRAYGLWALSKELHIVMDKPLTARQHAAISEEDARGIIQDYIDLSTVHQELQTRKETVFVVSCQRRYHPGFQFVLEMLTNVAAKTGSPVTNIISTHCDGQWRFPSEIVDLDYHGFNAGYGKVSHSGYHILDCLQLFSRAGMGDKRPDKIEVVSTFIQPSGFFKSLNSDDYSRIFGNIEYNTACKYTDKELEEMFPSFGEIDASIQITFFRQQAAVCLAQANLQHNSFSRRHWLQPDEDLYKGNGRVKHEFHEIKSGPFQTIVIDSRQANDKHVGSGPSTLLPGSDNHFEIQVYRNSGIFGEEVPLRVYSVADVDREDGHAKKNGLLSENVKRGILEEVVEHAEGKKSAADMKSNLKDHSLPVHLMSATYISYIRRCTGRNPIVTLELTYDNDNSIDTRLVELRE